VLPFPAGGSMEWKQVMREFWARLQEVCDLRGWDLRMWKTAGQPVL
jgi:hypothetical protein